MLQHYALMLNYSAETLPAALEFICNVSTVWSTNTVQLFNAQPHPAILLPATLWFNSYCSTVCSTDTVQLNAQRTPAGHNPFTIVYCLKSSCTRWACTRTRIPSSRQIRHKVVDQQYFLIKVQHVTSGHLSLRDVHCSESKHRLIKDRDLALI